MSEKRVFNADNWTAQGESITCGICSETVPLSARTVEHPELNRRRGAFLAHAARSHLPLLAGAFNSEDEYARARG